MSDPSAPEETPAAPTRTALPWQVVVAATVLALLAAGLVLVLATRGGGGSDRGETAPDDNSGFTLTPEDQVPTGDPLDIAFTDVDDTTGTLRDLVDGTPTVVNFFASWCSPCIKEMPDFEAVAQSLDGRVQFFGLAVNDRPEDAQGIVEQTGITYDWSRDIRGDIANAAGIPSLPATVLIAPDGTIAGSHIGALDQAGLRKLIADDLGVTS